MSIEASVPRRWKGKRQRPSRRHRSHSADAQTPHHHHLSRSRSRLVIGSFICFQFYLLEIRYLAYLKRWTIFSKRTEREETRQERGREAFHLSFFPLLYLSLFLSCPPLSPLQSVFLFLPTDYTTTHFAHNYRSGCNFIFLYSFILPLYKLWDEL